MRKTFVAWSVLGLFCAVALSGQCHAADDKVTLTGTFEWSHQAGSHPITAVFTPNGDKKWNVVYNFDWGARGAQAWKGTAEGDLKTGTLKGEGLHPDGHRKFTFSGTIKDGKINCTHNEVTSGTAVATGTMTLKTAQ